MPQCPDPKKYAQMCERMATECRCMAADVPEPDLRAYFLRLAGQWAKLAAQPRVLN